jgi:hypothetical protein
MKKDVIIISALAGGGHKSAMYSLGESLQRFTPELKVGYFESRVEDIEQAHRIVYSKFQRLYDSFYNLMECDALRGTYFCSTRLMIDKLRAELTDLIAEPIAPVVVSTHFMQTYALLQLKVQHDTDVKIVAYVPDFDESLIHIPTYNGLLPDAVIAQSPSYLAKLRRKYAYLPQQTIQAGYVPRKPFSEARALSTQAARVALGKQNLLSLSRLSPDRFTVVATGGAYWVEHLYSAFEQLAEQNAFDWEHGQALIVCGNNQRAFEKFSRLAAHTGRHIFALPFLNAEQMALVFRSADATVLSGIAPATLYELLETDAGPIFIHRINPGPEKFNLQMVQAHALADYRPQRAELLSTLEFLSRNPKAAFAAKTKFCQQAHRERAAAQARAKAVAEFLEQLLVARYAS